MALRSKERCMLHVRVWRCACAVLTWLILHLVPGCHSTKHWMKNSMVSNCGSLPLAFGPLLALQHLGSSYQSSQLKARAHPALLSSQQLRRMFTRHISGTVAPVSANPVRHFHSPAEGCHGRLRHPLLLQSQYAVIELSTTPCWPR